MTDQRLGVVYEPETVAVIVPHRDWTDDPAQDVDGLVDRALAEMGAVRIGDGYDVVHHFGGYLDSVPGPWRRYLGRARG